MACIVYREGTGTIVLGIECESARCEIEYLDQMLSSGWSANPPGYVAPLSSSPENDDETLHPIRVAARDAGIDGWDSKRIKTLETMLEG